MFRFLGISFLGLSFSIGCAIDKEAIENRIASDKQKKSAIVKPLPQISQPMANGGNIRSIQDYILGAEDDIRISVLNDSSLNSEQSVRPDGKISFYPTGDMQAAGLTLEELRKQIVKRLKNIASQPYILGVGDVLAISVYNHSDLTTTQAIRPDGKISIIPGGDIMAQGLTIGELRTAVEAKLRKLLNDPIVNIVVDEFKSKPIIISDPIVNVVVLGFNSKKVSILGEVEKPGILRLKSDTHLIEGISLMGGLAKTADLKRAMIFRDQKILPINFKKLFKQGDISQNIYLEAGDTIFIPSSLENKVYVIGEIEKPGTVTWEGDLRLLEAITLAGGYTRDSMEQNVLVIKGSLADPTLILVDARSITKEGMLENNVQLESGDTVYVPNTLMPTLERYLDLAVKILTLVVLADTGSIGINLNP
jgi:polysaccharide biosynthesis/export protein